MSDWKGELSGLVLGVILGQNVITHAFLENPSLD